MPIQFFQHYLLKSMSFSPCVFFSTFQRSTGQEHVSLFLGSLLCSIDLYVYFYAFKKWAKDTNVSCCFVFYILVIEFDVMSLALFFLLEIALAFGALFGAHIHFRIVFSNSVKKCHWYFDSNCIEFVDCFGWYGHFTYINSSGP